MVWKKVFSWRVASKNVLISTLIALAMIAPWTVRNYMVSHAFVPIATGDGTVLLGAYNQMVLTRDFAGGFYGSWINPLLSTPNIAHRFPNNCAAPCEVAREDYYKKYVEQWVLAHKQTTLHLLALHTVNLWLPVLHEADLPTDRFPNQRSTHVVVFMMKTFPTPLFILAVLGLLATLWRWRELLFIYLMILMTIAEGIIFYSSARFRAPIEPMLILLAAGAVWWLTSKERGTLRWLFHRHQKPAKTATDETDNREISSPVSSAPSGDEQMLATDK